MNRYLSVFTAYLLLMQTICFANSVSLFNDTPYRLDAIIYDANGMKLGEFVLNPRDATEWSDDDQNLGTEIADSSQTPYTVNWFCMNGGSYGVCTNVAAGAVVTAQSCGGQQECPQEPQSESNGLIN